MLKIGTELHPTRDELLAAARWTRIQDPSEGFLFVLGQLLKELGHADLIDNVQTNRTRKALLLETYRLALSALQNRTHVREAAISSVDCVARDFRHPPKFRTADRQPKTHDNERAAASHPNQKGPATDRRQPL